MKNISTYIFEKLKKINSKNTGKQHNYFPENIFQLHAIINRLIKERGKEADLNDIDTSKITNMNSLFSYTNFNGDISTWDTSNVKHMNNMFIGSNFNGDISQWDISNVESMRDMFFNCPLEKHPPKWYKE